MATMMAASEGWTDERLDDLNHKVDRLDRRMETGFGEVRAEFRALRGEMKDEFASVRGEMKGEFASVRGEMKDEFRAFRGEMGVELRGVRAEIGALNRSCQQLTWGLIGVMLVGFLSLAAAIVTQL